MANNNNNNNSNNNKSDDDDDNKSDEDFAGYVTPRVRNLNFDMTSVSGSNATSSQRTQTSWAKSGDGDRQQTRSQVSSPMSTPSRAAAAQRARQRNVNVTAARGGRTPPRPTPPTANRTTTTTAATNSRMTMDDFSLPPELPSQSQQSQQSQHKHESSFKSWLTAGVLESFNLVAGVTLSTTGTLMAPPLQMTKSVLLPALLALFIDTLDTITPPRVQDWFRVVSSSVYHLISVLRATEKGQQFSTQFIVILKDIVQAFSSPETRQVLVEGMATNVKLADALNTPETHALLEQLAVLGCRLVDAAASGKSKQLLQDGKDLVWKGIEMAADPATTLALAEVTAHLCHVLEDTEHYIQQRRTTTTTNNRRTVRNAQNQSTYLDAIHFSDFNNRATTEDVILSCLGCLEDNNNDDNTDVDDDERDENEDARSVPSNVLLSIDTPTTTTATVTDDHNTTSHNNDNDDWKDRGERVNVDLLKEKILRNERRQPPRSGGGGGAGVASALSSAKSSVASENSTEEQHHPSNAGPQQRSNNNNNANNNNNNSKRAEEIGSITDNKATKLSAAAGMFTPAEDDSEDMEDIVPGEVPKMFDERNVTNYLGQYHQQSQHRHHHHHHHSGGKSTVGQFYAALDDLLVEKRRIRTIRQTEAEDAEIHNRGGISFTDNDNNKDDASRRKLLEATVKKWKSGSVKKSRDARLLQRTAASSSPLKFQNLSKAQKYAVILLALVIGAIFLMFFAFAIYGMLTVWRSYYGASSSSSSSSSFFPAAASNTARRVAAAQNTNPTEIVIRVVKEVVHKLPDGSTINVGGDGPSFEAVTENEIQRVAECVQSSLVGGSSSS